MYRVGGRRARSEAEDQRARYGGIQLVTKASRVPTGGTNACPGRRVEVEPVQRRSRVLVDARGPRGVGRAAPRCGRTGAAHQAPRVRRPERCGSPASPTGEGVAAWGSAAAASAASSERRATAATPVTTGADRITTPDVTADAMDSGVSWRDRPAGHERRKSRGRPQVCRRRGGGGWHGRAH